MCLEWWHGIVPVMIVKVLIMAAVEVVMIVAIGSGLKICGILVANATMFSHLLPGFSCGSKHLLLP